MNGKQTGTVQSNGYALAGAAAFGTPALNSQPGQTSGIKKSGRKPDRYATGGNDVNSQIAEEDLKFMVNSPPENKGKALQLQAFQTENAKPSKGK